MVTSKNEVIGAFSGKRRRERREEGEGERERGREGEQGGEKKVMGRKVKKE